MERKSGSAGSMSNSYDHEMATSIFPREFVYMDISP